MLNPIVSVIVSFVISLLSIIFSFINAFRSAFIIGGLVAAVIFAFPAGAHASVFDAPPVVTCEVPPTEHSGAYVREMISVCSPSELVAYDAAFPVSEWTLLSTEKKVALFLLFFVVGGAIYFIIEDYKEKKEYRNKYTS